MTGRPAGARRQAQVVVLAKSPVAGRSKTRLVPAYSPAQAARLARAALTDTLRAAADAAVVRTLLALDGPPGDWLPSSVATIPQRVGPLDERIGQAMVDAWAQLQVPVLLVGMDTPQVSAADLDRAVDRLLAPGTDAVLGPACDGGFWALGVRRPHLTQVRGVPMSREDTGARALDRLRSVGLRVALLETRRDVDVAADAAAVAREAPASAFACALTGLAGGIP